MRETSGNNDSYKQVRKNTSLNDVIYVPAKYRILIYPGRYQYDTGSRRNVTVAILDRKRNVFSYIISTSIY